MLSTSVGYPPLMAMTALGVRVAYGAKRLELASHGRRLGHILGDLDARPRIAAGRHEIHLAGPRLPYCDVIAS